MTAPSKGGSYYEKSKKSKSVFQKADSVTVTGNKLYQNFPEY